MFKVMTWNVGKLFKACSASGPATTAVYEEKLQGLASMIPYHLLHASQWRDPRCTPVGLIEDESLGYLPPYDPDLMTLFNPQQRELATRAITNAPVQSDGLRCCHSTGKEQAMALNLTPPANVSELFEVGPVVHALAAGRQFRIETMRALHQSPTSKQWFAVYYEDKAVTGTQPIPGGVWTRMGLPWASGNTPEDCLRQALASLPA